MSLISDALKKAELQRSQPTVARGSVWDRGIDSDGDSRKAAPASSRALFVANIAVLAIICVVALYFVRNQPMAASGDSQIDSSRNSTEPAVVTIDSVTPSAPATTENSAIPEPIAVSPFIPPATAASINNPPITDDYILGGTSSLGSNTLLSVIRKSDRRSLWVPVGKTVGEVTAVSYNPDLDQGVISVRGKLLSITMNDSAASAE
jgi:hypothetical protein